MNKIQNNSVNHNIKSFFINILLRYLYKIEEKVLEYAVDKRFTPKESIERVYEFTRRKPKAPEKIEDVPFPERECRNSRLEITISSKKRTRNRN